MRLRTNRGREYRVQPSKEYGGKHGLNINNGSLLSQMNRNS